ncbi:MAG: S-layer protein [archaeon]
MTAFISDNGNEIPTKLFTEVRSLKPLLSETGWKIFQLLSKKPSYPAEIAKELNLHEQKVYYYIKKLKSSGLIELDRTEERLGALAKYYRPSIESLSLIPFEEKNYRKKGFSFKTKKKELKGSLEEFFEPFIKDGKLNAKIVVGSPDPHGEFKARARDAHLAVEFSAFLGSLCSEIDFPFVFLDTEIKSIASENSNLIIVGGILTNKLTREINNKLNCKFIPFGGHWIIKSKASEKEYTEDSIGIIEKIVHPKYKNKQIMVIAGKRNAGTKAAITALVKNPSKIIKPNLFDKKTHSKVVEGMDLDGDGLIDEVEIKE